MQGFKVQFHHIKAWMIEASTSGIRIFSVQCIELYEIAFSCFCTFYGFPSIRRQYPVRVLA